LRKGKNIKLETLTCSVPLLHVLSGDGKESKEEPTKNYIIVVVAS